MTTLFAAREQELGATLGVHGGAALQVWNARAFVSPHVQVTWAPVPALVVTAAAKRGHQFVQSLRNPESVVGHVFPVDLFVGSSQNGIPVARSDEVSLTARLRPAPGWRIGAAAYARRMDGLVLVAPFEAGTFAQSDVGTGKGTAQGASVDAEVQSGRYMATASYGWQAVRYRYQGGAYIPEHGARHQVATGVTLFPSASSSIRLSALAAAGRRATGVVGSIDWEPCNILDRGCEFAGSPRIDPQALGASTVPRYARVDLSARKHWHVRTLDHDAELALFGTVTNVFNRRNVLTFVRNSGALTPLEMRPRAPLVVGLDWRF